MTRNLGEFDYGMIRRTVEWSAEGDFHEVLEEANNQLAVARFRRFCNEHPDRTLMLSAFDRLSTVRGARFATAPECIQLLSTSEKAHTILAALAYEATSQRTELRPEDIGLWSITGAAWIEDEDGVLRMRAAPILSNGVPVDFESPWTRTAMNEISGDDLPFGPSDQRQIFSKIEAAIGLIDQFSREAAALVARYCNVIVIRRDSLPSNFTSATTRSAPGRIVLRNPHALGANIHALADGLVHEAIHAMIDRLEQFFPLVPAGLERVRCRSPWTGRDLDLRTYLHACFIWYGLWKLWLGDPGPSQPKSNFYASRALGGFIGQSILVPLGLERARLAPSLIRTLDAMQEDIARDIA
ncbi:MAG: HEXXH motif-containing putative peptide modification protein [Pseudomonadota bacterium]